PAAARVTRLASLVCALDGRRSAERRGLGLAGAGECRDELLHLLALRFLVAALDCVLDAVGDVIAQDLTLDLAQGGDAGLALGHDVDAIAVVLDHLGEAANLAFHPIEARFDGFFRRVLHGRHVTRAARWRARLSPRRGSLTISARPFPPLRARRRRRRC